MPGLLDIPGITYTRTGAATAWDSFGNLIQFAANVPRITDAGITIEGQRTNLFAQWDPTAAQIEPKGNCSDVVAPAVAPLTGRNWVALDNTATIAYAYIHTPTATSPTGSTITLSVFVETPDGSKPVFGKETDNSADFTVRNLPSGLAVSSATAKYTRRAGNVWEVSVTGVTDTSGPLTAIGILRYTNHNKRPLKFSGFQLEPGSTPSTPIITTGAVATCGADNLALAKTIAAGEDFTVLVDATIASTTEQQRFFEWSDGTDNNRLLVDRIVSDVRGIVVVGGATFNLPAISGNGGARRVKVALRRKGNNYVACAGGVISAPTSIAGMPNLPTVTIGNRRTLTNAALNGSETSFITFPFALTDAELVEMTR